MAEGHCPDCEEYDDLGNHPRKRQRVPCPNCHTHLEVVALSPTELDWAYDGYDDDDEEDGYDGKEFDD